MKKAKRLLSVLLICALVFAFSLTAAANASGGKNDWNGIVWEQDPIIGALFIKGIGTMPVDRPMPWAEFAADNTAVCFDSGVTDIPAGFTDGCVNMRTIMIPASLRSIGQGVLAVSSGLSDVYYEGTLQSLLSIQMFPEDRAALNGAVFHGSKIVYKDNGEFEYIQAEGGEVGKMDFKQDGTVTVTHDDGTKTTYTYERHYDESGNLVSAEYHSDKSDIYFEYEYWENGIIKTITTRHHEHDEELGIDQWGYLTQHYTKEGVLAREDFVSDNTSATVTREYYPDGKTIKQRTMANSEGAGSVYNYNENGAKTFVEYTFTDGSRREYEFVGEKGQEKQTKRTTYFADDSLLEDYYTDDVITKSVHTSQDGEKDIKIFDTDGNMTSKELVSPAGDSSLKWEYVDGKLVNVILTSVEEGKTTYKYYDATNKFYKQVITEQDGTVYTAELVDGKEIDTTEYPPGSNIEDATQKEIKSIVSVFNAEGMIETMTTNYADNSWMRGSFENGVLVSHVETYPDGTVYTLDYKTYELKTTYTPGSISPFINKELSNTVYSDLDGKEIAYFTDGSYSIETRQSDTETSAVIYDSSGEQTGSYTTVQNGNLTLVTVYDIDNNVIETVRVLQNSDNSLTITRTDSEGTSITGNYTNTFKYIGEADSPTV